MTFGPLRVREVVQVLVEEEVDPTTVVLAQLDVEVQSLIEWGLGQISDGPCDRPCRPTAESCLDIGQRYRRRRPTRDAESSSGSDDNPSPADGS